MYYSLLAGIEIKESNNIVVIKYNESSCYIPTIAEPVASVLLYLFPKSS